MRIALYLNILIEEYQISVYRAIRASAAELGIGLVCVQDQRLIGGRRTFPLTQYLPVDGILILTSVIIDADDRIFMGGINREFPGLPVVAVGNGIPGIPSVLIRGSEAMHYLMQHLIEVHGYRRFLFLGGHAEHRDNREREKAFRELTGGTGRGEKLEGMVVNSNFTEEGGAKVVRALIARTGSKRETLPPDAIVAASDNMAIGVLRALRESGDSRWQSCAVTGFDDIPQAALEVPSLTTAHQPFDLAGKIAVETIQSLIEGRAVKDTVTIEAIPVIRASCGCAEITRQGSATDPKAGDELIAPRERLVRLQRQKSRSEQLLRSVSLLGQRLATVASIPEIMPHLAVFLGEIDARAFFLALFPSGTVRVPDHCALAYEFREGSALTETGKQISLADFLSHSIDGSARSIDGAARSNDGATGRPVSRSVYQLVAGEEIPGIIVYEVDDDVLPHMHTSAVFIANTVKRLYVLDTEKEHSRELEREVALRTRDLSETNRKLAEEAERRKEVEAEVLRIGELERQRFSLDLHDDICQRLAGISMYCKSLAPQSANPGSGAMAELSQMIDETLTRTRQYAHDSFPVELDSLGLRDALGALCLTTQKQTGCDCAFSWEAAPVSPLGRARDINVYRIVQEALANAVRHSRATRVEVSVREEETAPPGKPGKPGHTLFVRIRDNGKGDATLENDENLGDGREDKRRGLGLRSMRYRARQIGATYHIASSAENGTCIELGMEQTP